MEKERCSITIPNNISTAESLYLFSAIFEKLYPLILFEKRGLCFGGLSAAAEKVGMGPNKKD
jgi:hypothetical protein